MLSNCPTNLRTNLGKSDGALAEQMAQMINLNPPLLTSLWVVRARKKTGSVTFRYKSAVGGSNRRNRISTTVQISKSRQQSGIISFKSSLN